MADSLALFRQLRMQPIQTVQAAEPIAIGNVRPALAFRRYPAAVGAPVHRPYQYDAHNLLQEPFGATTTRVILRQKWPAPSLWKTQQFCTCAAVLAFLAAWSGEQWTLTRLRRSYTLPWSVLFASTQVVAHRAPTAQRNPRHAWHCVWLRRCERQTQHNGRTIPRPAPRRMSYNSVGHSRGPGVRRLEYFRPISRR